MGYDIYETKRFMIFVIVSWSIFGNALFFSSLYVLNINYSIWQLFVAVTWVIFCIFNTMRVNRKEKNKYPSFIKPLNLAMKDEDQSEFQNLIKALDIDVKTTTEKK